MITREYKIAQDIQLCAITAASFPAGIKAAFEKLGAAVPPGAPTWGLSRSAADGNIVYKAAAEAPTPGDAGFETLVLPKGKYLGMEISDFMNNVSQIGAVFQMLLHSPGLDPNGYCVERYISDKDVICMVRVID